MFINLDRRLWKAWIAEFIGSFMLNFYGCGSLAANNCYGYGLNDDNKGGDDSPDVILVAALAFGGIIICCIVILGPVSGCHINPGVTIAFMSIKMMPPLRGFGYLLVQCCGCTLGSFVVWLLLPLRDKMISQAANELNWRHGIYSGQGFAYEYIMTLVLMFTVLAVTDMNRLEPLPNCPIVVGIVIIAMVCVSGHITTCSLNPARSLGAAVLTLHWSYFWVFVIAPPLGAVTAAVVYKNALTFTDLNEDIQPET